MKISSLLPAGFDSDDFLRNYWQKKPLLIRAADSQFQDPIEADELAGLACESFVESRLISSDVDQLRWNVRNGPFTEEDFKALPPTHWSLLVQAVDHYHPGVKSLLKEFDFIPGWRIDDIMVSFASDGGGVGPHFDYYDVFLIQGLGSKRWRLGGHADSSSALLPGTDLRLLQDFKTQEDWIVEAGDILYLPPNLAHHGVAIGDSLTYSIGFRAPSLAQIIDDLSSEIMLDLQEDQRYVDPTPRRPRRSGEIEADTGAQIAALLRREMLDETRISQWFARYMTRPKYPGLHEEVYAGQETISAEQLRQRCAAGMRLQKNPASRFAFTKGEAMTLFVDGQQWTCSPNLADWAPKICDPEMDLQDWQMLLTAHPEGANLVVALYNQGSLLFDEDE